MSELNSFDEQYFTVYPSRNGVGYEIGRRTSGPPSALSYLLGGLLPRPRPEGLPVWLGAF